MSDTHKECKTCKEAKPRATGYYGKQTECKQCQYKRKCSNARERWRKPKDYGNPDEYKQCYSCKVMLPATVTNFDRGAGKYNLRNECKMCRKSRQKNVAAKQARLERLAEKIRTMGVGA